MATQLKKKEDVAQEAETLLTRVVEEQVVHLLGQPSGVRRLQVRPLWKGCFRVNVFVDDDSGSSRMGSSYFVRVGGDGSILESTPRIEGRPHA